MIQAGIGEKEVGSVMGRFDTDLADRLETDYGTDIWNDLNDWKPVALEQEGQFVHYVHISPPESKITEIGAGGNLLVIPGFLGSIQAYAPFAGAMAQYGYNVLLPHSNRADITEAASNQPLAARQQAKAIRLVIKDAQLQDTPLQVVAHSYGAIIFEELVKIAEEEGWTCFKAAGAALLAPAGIHEDSRAAFWWRSTVLGRSASVESFTDDYRDVEGTVDRVAQELRRANPKRARMETREVATHMINLEELQRRVARLAIVPFAGDILFPDSRFATPSSYERFVSHESTLDNVVVFMPYSTVPISQDRPGEIRGARGSNHADILANAAREAAAVVSFLQSVGQSLAWT